MLPDVLCVTEGLIDLDLHNIIVLFAVSTSLSITLSSSGDRLVGGTFSLTCSASVSGGGSVSRIVWLRGTTIEMEMNTVSTLILTFQPLNASDEGSYTCRVEVGNLVKMKSTELEVLISNPSKFQVHSRNCILYTN